MIGSAESSYTLLLSLIDKLIETKVVVSPFHGYILLTYDPFLNNIVISTTEGQKHFIVNECDDFEFIRKTEVTIESITDKRKYLFEMENIFTNDKQISILEVDDFLKFSKGLELTNAITLGKNE
jgi:hypothetical protein